MNIPNPEPCDDCGNNCYDVGEGKRKNCCNCGDIDDQCPDCEYVTNESQYEQEFWEDFEK